MHAITYLSVGYSRVIMSTHIYQLMSLMRQDESLNFNALQIQHE